MLKTLLKIAGVSLALVALLIISFIFLADVNSYRDAIRDAIAESTGYELTIAGDMDINFFPTTGLTLNDVRLKNPNLNQELASTTAITLRVNLFSLISGELIVKELSADDFHINYYTDSEGNSAWDIDHELIITTVDSDGNEVDVSTSEIDPVGGTVTPSIELIRIDNASIDIQDLSTGTKMGIDSLDIVSRDSNVVGRPFPIDVSMQYLSDGMSEAKTIGLNTNVVANLDDGLISLDISNFSLTPMSLQGQVAISGLNEELRFEGNMKSNSFDAIGLLQSLGMMTDDEDLRAPSVGGDDQQLSFEFDFNGDDTEITVPNFIARMGVSEIEAEGSIRLGTDFSPAIISYDVRGNSLDLTPFMSDSASGMVAGSEIENGSEAPTTAPPIDSTEETLPFELLNDLNVNGSVALQLVIANGIEYRDVNIFTYLEDSILNIESQPISTMGGTIMGNLSASPLNDGGGDVKALFTLNNINMIELVPFVSQLEAVTGNLNVEMSYESRGRTTTELMDTLSGSTTFAVTDNSVDISLLKQVFTAITALSPTGDTIQQWPDVIQFGELAGYLIFQDGIDADQEVKIRMDNFDISGTGGIDMAAQSFDYDMSFSILGEPAPQTIPIGERYHNVEWPVDCAAAIEDPVSQYCGPDFTRVREIFAQMATNEVRLRAEDEITNRLPEELQDSARGLLRSILN